MVKSFYEVESIEPAKFVYSNSSLFCVLYFIQFYLRQKKKTVLVPEDTNNRSIKTK